MLNSTELTKQLEIMIDEHKKSFTCLSSYFDNPEEAITMNVDINKVVAKLGVSKAAELIKNYMLIKTYRNLASHIFDVQNFSTEDPNSSMNYLLSLCGVGFCGETNYSFLYKFLSEDKSNTPIGLVVVQANNGKAHILMIFNHKNQQELDAVVKSDFTPAQISKINPNIVVVDRFMDVLTSGTANRVQGEKAKTRIAKIIKMTLGETKKMTVRVLNLDNDKKKAGMLKLCREVKSLFNGLKQDVERSKALRTGTRPAHGDGLFDTLKLIYTQYGLYDEAEVFYFDALLSALLPASLSNTGKWSCEKTVRHYKLDGLSIDECRQVRNFFRENGMPDDRAVMQKHTVKTPPNRVFYRVVLKNLSLDDLMKVKTKLDLSAQHTASLAPIRAQI